MFVLLVPVIIGAGANSINMVVDTNIGSTLGVGIMSNLEYGQKIISFINTAITIILAQLDSVDRYTSVYKSTKIIPIRILLKGLNRLSKK